MHCLPRIFSFPIPLNQSYYLIFLQIVHFIEIPILLKYNCGYNSLKLLRHVDLPVDKKKMKWDDLCLMFDPQCLALSEGWTLISNPPFFNFVSFFCIWICHNFVHLKTLFPNYHLFHLFPYLLIYSSIYHFMIY